MAGGQRCQRAQLVDHLRGHAGGGGKLLTAMHHTVARANDVKALVLAHDVCEQPVEDFRVGGLCGDGQVDLLGTAVILRPHADAIHLTGHLHGERGVIDRVFDRGGARVQDEIGVLAAHIRSFP